MSSALGKALGMTSTYTWAQVVSALTGVANNGVLNWSEVYATYTLVAGYYTGGTIDSRPSYTRGVNDADNRANPNTINYQTGYSNGVTDADNRANPNTVNYQTGYNNGYNAANDIRYTSGSVTSVNSSKPVGSRMFTIWNIGFNPVMVFAYGGGHTNYHSFRYVNSMFWSQSSTGFSNVSGYASSFSFTSSSIELPTLEAANTTIYYFAVGYV